MAVRDSTERRRWMTRFDPLVPRPIDLPTAVPLDPDADLAGAGRGEDLRRAGRPGRLAGLARALARWRDGARERVGLRRRGLPAAGPGVDPPCFAVAQVWLWDEMLYDYDARRFTPERLLADARERSAGSTASCSGTRTR